MVQLLLKLQVATSVIEYHLDQLNNKHTKVAVNWAIQYFEGHSQNNVY